MEIRGLDRTQSGSSSCRYPIRSDIPRGQVCRHTMDGCAVGDELAVLLGMLLALSARNSSEQNIASHSTLD
jgi:hypothetical protein